MIIVGDFIISEIDKNLISKKGRVVKVTLSQEPLKTYDYVHCIKYARIRVFIDLYSSV